MKRFRAMLIALCAFATAALAQDYPSRPLKLIVPFARDGGTDIAGRALAERLMPHLKQPVVVENVAGRAGMAGTEAAAKAAPDGYTLLLATDATLVTVPIIERARGYDPLASFAPVSLVTSMAGVAAVSPALKARNLEELVALARAAPGRIRYVTTGPGTSTWLGAELFKSQLKVEMQEVRRRAWPEVPAALAGGTADVVFATSVLLEAAVRDGNAKPIAVLGHAPLPTFPGVSTAAAQGVPGLTMYTWTGLLAPAGTPEAIVQKLSSAVRAALDEPETKVLFGRYRLAAEGTPPEWFRDFIRAELAKWRQALGAP